MDVLLKLAVGGTEEELTNLVTEINSMSGRQCFHSPVTIETIPQNKNRIHITVGCINDMEFIIGLVELVNA